MAAGVRARLETVKVGMTRYTSVEAIERFSAVLDGYSGRRRGRRAVATERSPQQRQRVVDAAKAKLMAEGYM